MSIKKEAVRNVGICHFCLLENSTKKPITEFAYRKVRLTYASDSKEWVCEKHIIDKGCLE